MKRIPFLLSILALAGCGGGSDDSVARGRAYFKGYGCVSCHTVGEGGGKYGPDLSYVGFRKSQAWLDVWLKNPHAWKPNTAMPNFHLSDAVRRDLVAYLTQLKGEADKKQAPWNTEAMKADPVKRGQAIFSRVGCTGCHGPTGEGGYPNNNVVGGKIPSLTFVADGYSKEELKARIRNGVKPEKADPRGPEPMLYMPAWGEILKDDEIDALADYLISLRPKKTGSDDDF